VHRRTGGKTDMARWSHVFGPETLMGRLALGRLEADDVIAEVNAAARLRLEAEGILSRRAESQRRRTREAHGYHVSNDPLGEYREAAWNGEAWVKDESRTWIHRVDELEGEAK
jgi:hypothetical protein